MRPAYESRLFGDGAFLFPLHVRTCKYSAPENPRGTGSTCRCGKLNGGLPRRCRLGECQRRPAGAQGGGRLPTLPLRCSQGGLPALSPAYPAFNLLPCPLSPRPPSPVGQGVTIGYFMQGASPLASPGLNPGGTGAGAHITRWRGACPVGCRLTLPFRNPQGWLALFVACLPCRRVALWGGAVVLVACRPCL